VLTPLDVQSGHQRLLARLLLRLPPAAGKTVEMDLEGSLSLNRSKYFD